MTLTAKVPKKNLNLATPRNCRKRGREIDDNGATVQAKRVLKTPGSGSSNCHRNSPVKGQRAKALVRTFITNILQITQFTNLQTFKSVSKIL